MDAGAVVLDAVISVDCNSELLGWQDSTILWGNDFSRKQDEPFAMPSSICLTFPSTPFFQFVQTGLFNQSHPLPIGSFRQPTSSSPPLLSLLRVVPWPMLLVLAARPEVMFLLDKSLFFKLKPRVLCWLMWTDVLWPWTAYYCAWK